VDTSTTGAFRVGAPRDETTADRLWFPVVVFVVFSLFSGWVISEHSRMTQWRERWLKGRTKDISLALFGMVNAQLVRGAFVTRGRLNGMLDAMVRANSILHQVELFGVDNTLLAKAVQENKVDSSYSRRDKFLLTRPFVFPGTLPEPSSTTTSIGLVRPLVLDRLPTKRMTEKKWKALRRSALHMALIVLDAGWIKAAETRSKWRAGTAIFLAAISAVALILFWRNFKRSARLMIRLVQAREKNLHLEEMRIAAAGLAHETKNPLNVVRSIAQAVGQNPNDTTKLEERTNIIIEEVDRINARLAEFINFSRPRAPELRPTNPSELFESLASLLCDDAADVGVKIRVESKTSLISSDEGLLRQAIFNLAINAIDAAPAGGTVTLRHGTTPDGLHFIEVEDDGEGVKPENRQDVFMPYFTMTEQGTGLGLAVVNQIVTTHGWEITYVDRPTTGAVFRIDGIEAS